MQAVSDTSPLLSLAIIGRLDLLEALCERVYVPPAVVAELRVDEYRLGSEELRTLRSASWIEPLALPVDVTAGRPYGICGDGEAQAIALARHLGLRVILIDERSGRAKARRAGLRPLGVLGVLLRCKRQGILGEVAPVLEALRTEAAFYVTEALVERVLREAGER